MKQALCFTILILFLTSNILALGVTPARNTIDFVPDYSGGGSFKILNTENIERELVIKTRGELGSNIDLDKRRVNFAAGEKESVVNYGLTLPSTLSPGLHIGEIVISEPEEEILGGDTIVGAKLSVVTQIYVYVPVPGKYADGKLNIKSAGPGEDIVFSLSVVSKGEFDLTNVYANIDIYSELNEKVDSFNTKSIEIKSKQKADIVHNWRANVLVGNYRAVVTLVYDGETISLQDTFQVGREFIEVQQITVNNFQLGEIAKLELLVESKWSEAIEKVHTEIQIFSSSGDILSDFKSPDATIPPLSKTVLTSYWDSAGVKEGTYDTKVIVHYGSGKQTDTDIQLVVKSNSLEVIGLGYVLSDSGGGFEISENLVMILIIIIGLLVLVNVLWFLVLRRALKKK